MLENYIPCSRSRLIELCIESSELAEEEQQQFRQLCKILLAFVHYQEQENLEQLKDWYRDFDPNDEIPRTNQRDANKIINSLSDSLLAANYKKIQASDIEEALNGASLIPVQTDVDFSIYENYSFFYRQRNKMEIKKKKWFKEKTLSFDNYSRMVVLLQIKKGIQDQLEKKYEGLLAGKIYLYLYKNIPHYDLEMLFPSLEISMTLKDRLMLIVPAVGAAIPMLLKVLPSLALLIGAIAFFTFGLKLEGFDATEQDNQALYALLTAGLSIAITLGGFAGAQYVKYKSKRLSFLKRVTDVLFFKCLDTGTGVIHKVIDAAEEELCKEMILVLHILSTSKTPLDAATIDKKIEDWVKVKLDQDMDFDVHKAIETLEQLTKNNNIESPPLLERGTDGRYTLLPLTECKRTIDRIWDNLFQYN